MGFGSVQDELRPEGSPWEQETQQGPFGTAEPPTDLLLPKRTARAWGGGEEQWEKGLFCKAGATEPPLSQHLAQGARMLTLSLQHS